MNKYPKIIIIFALLSAPACDDHDCPDGIDNDYSLSYSTYGSYVGESWELRIEHDGYMEVRNTYSELGDEIEALVVEDSLTANEKADWGQRIEDAGFYCLDDNYPTVKFSADGYYFDMTVTTGGETKAVHVDQGSNAPKRLERLLWDLFVDVIHPVYHDSATAGTILVRSISKLITWPFSELAPLSAGRTYTLSEIDSTGEIATYLNDLYYPGGNWVAGVDYRFVDGDRHYRLGYFLEDEFIIHDGDYLRDWPENIPFDLADIETSGMVVEGDLYKLICSTVGKAPDIRSYFLDREPADETVVYGIILWPGEPLATY